MSDVQTVIVQISPDQITEGYYIVDGETLIMTYADGTPADADHHRHKLRAGDDPHVIAGLMTKKVRSALLGETVPGFNNPIQYLSQGRA
jgi:hypothetical protein